MLRLSSSLLLATLSFAASTSAQNSNAFHSLFARKLQGDVPDFFSPGNGICHNDTTVQFTEGFSQGFEAAAFAPEYQPDCQCQEESNEDVLKELVESDGPKNISDIEPFLEEFNALLGDLKGSSDYNCLNKCETCLDDTKSVCGVVQTVQSYYFGLAPGNFSFTDLGSLAGAGATTQAAESFAEFVDELDFRTDLCFTYTKGEGLVGSRTCMSVQIDETQDPSGDITCVLSLDGKNCDSCTVTQDGCIKATCSGDSSGGAISTKQALVIDTCAGTGFDGPYQFLEFFQEGADVSDLVVGECGDFNLPDMEIPDNTAQGNNGPTDNSSAPSASILAVIVSSIVAMLL